MSKKNDLFWHVVKGRTHGSLEVFSGDIAIAEIWRRGDEKTESANARLLAAAPELLAALQEVIAAADGKGWEQLSPSLENQRRAVEKALSGVRVK